MDMYASVMREMSSLNSDVPIDRRTLNYHIDTDNWKYKTRKGHECVISEEEVNILKNNSTEIERISLKLPIFLRTDAEGEAPAWIIEGKAEASVVSKVLGKRNPDCNKLRIYGGDMRTLTKILPNAIFVVYG